MAKKGIKSRKKGWGDYETGMLGDTQMYIGNIPRSVLRGHSCHCLITL